MQFCLLCLITYSNNMLTTPPITFVTGNPNKLRELMAVAPAGMAFASRVLDIDEIQSFDPYEIVRDKLHKAYAQIQTPVIVEDVSAGLASLNGLPGPFIKFFEEQLGRGALFQLSKVTDDAVTITCIAGYYDGSRIIFGEGIVKGTIVAPRGEGGFGFDCVVVPDGYRRTTAELSTSEKNTVSHRALAMRDLFSKLT